MSKDLASYLREVVNVSDIYEIRDIAKLVGKGEVETAIEDIVFYGEYDSEKFIFIREDKISKPEKSGEEVLKELGKDFKELFLGIFRIFAISK